MENEDERRINSDRKDKTGTERQRRKRKILSEILSRFGWDSEYQLLTAIKKGEVEPPQKKSSK